MVITLFRGQRLKIYAESSLGWTPIGKEFTVTDIRSNNIVKSLDGELAGNIYKKYLGVNSKVTKALNCTHSQIFTGRRRGALPFQKFSTRTKAATFKTALWWQ